MLDALEDVYYLYFTGLGNPIFTKCPDIICWSLTFLINISTLSSRFFQRHFLKTKHLQRSTVPQILMYFESTFWSLMHLTNNSVWLENWNSTFQLSCRCLTTCDPFISLFRPSTTEIFKPRQKIVDSPQQSAPSSINIVLFFSTDSSFRPFVHLLFVTVFEGRLHASNHFIYECLFVSASLL